MHSKWILWPLMAQLAIPFWVLVLNGLRKQSDRRAGRASKESLTNNKAWSEPVVLTSNSLDNQFQFPVVFYVLCLILAYSDAVTTFSLVLAWLFVFTRWGHAVVHVTTNKILWRSTFFISGMLMLLILFLHTFWILVS